MTKNQFVTTLLATILVAFGTVLTLAIGSEQSIAQFVRAPAEIRPRILPHIRSEIFPGGKSPLRDLLPRDTTLREKARNQLRAFPNWSDDLSPDPTYTLRP